MIKMGRIESTPTITVIRDLVMRNRRSRMISNVCVVYAITLLCLCGPGQVHCFSVGGVQEQPFVVDATIPDRQTNEVSFNENEVDEVPKTCESEIFCHGNLLEVVQMAQIYPDSKTFVDMKLKAKPSETLDKFKAFQQETNFNPTKEQIKAFVEANFEEPGQEFEAWKPDDWHEKPKFVEGIKDTKLQNWAIGLNRVWLDLGRKMKDTVKDHEDLYSIIYVPNPVIVPGGRFREFYYWDSYWIVKGLLHSEMTKTVHGMLENFLGIVQRYGFIPNGGRIYYASRSQPPLLPMMINAYCVHMGNNEFAHQSIETLEEEFNFFYNNYGVQVKGHTLYKYGYPSAGPRPESYREDVETAQVFTNPADREKMYAELKAGAESGMDFSSRWFISDSGTNNGGLIHLKTKSIVPVELNALLHWNAQYIANMYKEMGNTAKAENFQRIANNIFDAIEAVLFHDDLGIWLDYDLLNDKRRDYWVPTNLSPLFTGSFNIENKPRVVEGVLQAVKRWELDLYPGGVPNTLNPVHEQWDYPNVWPPMQHMLIVGLENMEDPRTSALAFKWATKWVHSGYLGWDAHEQMYEKYSCLQPGSHGAGGEYVVQLGFGWSNGVIMDLLNMYGDRLNSSSTGLSSGIFSSQVGAVFFAVIGILATKILGLLD